MSPRTNNPKEHGDARRRPPRHRAARALVWVVLVTGGLELVYLVVANVALAAMSARFAHRVPIAVTYDRAFTLYPGHARVRGLRLRASGWSLAADDCDIGFDPFAVITEPRRVQHVTANVTTFALESKGVTRSLSGAIRVDVQNASIDEAGVSFDARANVEKGRIESGGVVLADDVTGTVTIAATKSGASGTSGTATLSGKLLSLAPVASLASLTVAEDAGTLRIAGSWKSDVVQPASELRAEAPNVTMKDARGATTSFPRGLVVVASVSTTDATDSTIRFDLRAPHVAFASADAAEPPDELDAFALTAPLALRSLDWSAERVSMHEGATTYTFKVASTLHFEPDTSTKLVADSGTITASNIVAERPDATDPTPFDASIALTRMTISREDGMTLDGRLHVSGNDARPMIELFVASPSIRGSILPLVAHAFTADATLSRGRERVAFGGLELRCASLTIRGGYRRRAKESHGAFVVSGGPIPVGITQTGAKETIVVAPSASWLAAQLAHD